MALYEDVYTISLPRSGNAVIKDLSLTGWSTNSTWVESGRLYWIKTAANDLELYRDEGLDSSDLVAEGAITANEVTLVQANSSGINGSAFVNHTVGEESTGEIIVTYCYEDDVLTIERDLTDHLDSNSLFLGDVRFEQPLRAAKHSIDEILKSTLRPYFRRRNNKEVDLGAIAKPRQLAKAQAYFTMYYITMSVNSGDSEMMDLAKHYEKKAREALDIVHLELDFEGDDTVEGAPPVSGGRLTR